MLWPDRFARCCTSTRDGTLGTLRTDAAATELTVPVHRLEPHIGTGVGSPPVPLMRSAA